MFTADYLLTKEGLRNRGEREKGDKEKGYGGKRRRY